MNSKIRNTIIITFLLIVIIVLSVHLIPKKEKTVEEKPIVKVPVDIHSEFGILQDLVDEILYQNSNFKITFKVDNASDKINISKDDEEIIQTDYNHAAKVRVNMYNNLYIIEVHYTMAQCPTLKLFFLDYNGNPIEQPEIKDTISRIEYFDDVNKIITYKEECAICEDCGKKFTYELINNSFKLIKTESIYDPDLTKVESDSDYTYYSFNFSNHLNNVDDTYEFNIGEYKLKYIITKVDGFIKYYDFYINDKKVYSDMIDIDTIKIKKLGNYLIFTNTFSTDIRSTKLYVYDGTILKEIYELDEINGMVIESLKSIKISKDGILVSGTRLNNGPTIIYNGKSYDTYSKDTCSNTLKELKDDFIVKQDYFYKYTDSKLDFIPEVSNKYLLKSYVKKEEFCKSSIK